MAAMTSHSPLEGGKRHTCTEGLLPGTTWTTSASVSAACTRCPGSHGHTQNGCSLSSPFPQVSLYLCWSSTLEVNPLSLDSQGALPPATAVPACSPHPCLPVTTQLYPGWGKKCLYHPGSSTVRPFSNRVWNLSKFFLSWVLSLSPRIPEFPCILYQLIIPYIELIHFSVIFFSVFWLDPDYYKDQISFKNSTSQGVCFYSKFSFIALLKMKLV
jgi:hypothetical protein